MERLPLNGIKELIHEVHRRSLWQVTGIFLAASWGVLQVVEVLTETAGLPDWTPSMALVLLLLGLPVCLATAFVQEGMPGEGEREPGAEASVTGSTAHDGAEGQRSKTRRLLTWRNAILGGVGAFALLGFSLIAYFIMWSTGVGPVGNLQAQGFIETGDPVLLADFDDNTDDASLGDVVTEALRVDLATTEAITLVEPTSVSEILVLMGLPPETTVRGSVADELLLRGGYRAVIEGEVGSAGSGYVLLASIRAASGETLATFRRTASDASEVISAIDGLSQDIRERAGESLRSIRAGEPLEAVTTSSLEALRLYTEAVEARDRGELARARSLLEEAVQVDPDFAMGWRGLSLILYDVGGEPREVRDAAERAYQMRHRLTDRERYKAVAWYHDRVTGDLQQQIVAYQTLLDLYPDDETGLNNLGTAYAEQARWEDATALLEQAIRGPGTSPSAYTNLVLYLSLSGNFTEARRALEELETRFPENDLWRNWTGFILAWSGWDAEEARRRATALQGLADAPNWRRTGTRALAFSYVLTGEIAAAREVFGGARVEAERQGAPNDAVQAWLEQAMVDNLFGLDPTPTLEALLARGILDEIPPQFRSNGQWIPLIAWLGFPGEARRLLDEWEDAAAGLQDRQIRIARAVVDAYALADDDPVGATAALEELRTTFGCDRCGAWELGTLYERADRTQDAIREREQSVAAGQDFYYGMHRLAAHEALGRLYEEVGDTTKAVEHYTIYVDQLANGADLPFVQRTRARLASLAGR